jgi:hypothetical protein
VRTSRKIILGLVIDMAHDVFLSAVRQNGDLAGVFEYDGDTAYFYLFDVLHGEGKRILAAIHVLTGQLQMDASDILIRWDDSEERVGLFLAGRLWAIFNCVTGEKFGGDFRANGNPDIPLTEAF